METIPQKFIVDENNNKVAVQIDIAVYEKIEELLENYALAKLIERENSNNLELHDAKEYYINLP